MLDYERLTANTLLAGAGWSGAHKNLMQERLRHLNPGFPPQVPVESIFQSAWDIVDALDGICIKNLCPELGLGEECNVIEFCFFEYDSSIYSKLSEVCSQIGKRALYIGIGYDIIGDWLVDETGMIYFQNNIKNTLKRFSENIYDFLEKDIYDTKDLDKNSIFT